MSDAHINHKFMHANLKFSILSDKFEYIAILVKK